MGTKISALAAASALDGTEAFPIVQAGANRKATAQQLRLRGTSFPGSPASGDTIFRTDRGIDYYWDGTRWLSTQLFSYTIAAQDALNPATATNQFNRAANPFFGVYAIYVEKLSIGMLNSAVVASNYRTFVLKSNPADTTLASGIVTSGHTQNVWTGISTTVNAVVPSTECEFDLYGSPTGSPVTYVAAAITYRLIG